MPNLNRVMLMGNLTRDPEMRYTPSNMAITKLGLAVNRRWRNQQGEQQEEVTFVDCDAFGKTAETINQYLKKGRPIFIEGHLRLNQWQDKEGNNRSKLMVVIDNFQFIDSRGQADGEGGGGNYGGGENYGGGGGAGGGSGGGGRAPQRSQPRQNSGGGAGGGGGAGAGNGGGDYDGPPPSDPHQPMDDDSIPF
ncbi:MAG: single-stranded DNA-binding protein [Phycisphaeraceae bacterium]